MTSGNGKIIDTVNRLLIAGVLNGRRVKEVKNRGLFVRLRKYSV